MMPTFDLAWLETTMSAATAEIIELKFTPSARSILEDGNYLVRHDGRLYAFEDLLKHAPEAAFCAAMETSPDDPQQWWNELGRRYPTDARKTVAMCRSYGFVEPCRILHFPS